MKRLIPIFLIIIGLLLIIYPTAKDIYFAYQQRKIMADWQKSMLNIETQISDGTTNTTQLSGNELDQVEKTKEISKIVAASQLSENQIEKEKQERERLEREKQKKEEVKRRAEYIKSNMEGMLEIDKINLQIPILSEATKKNLDISVSSIINTGKAGQVGNYCIAGHNSKYYGKNFNRLDEVDIGDSVKVNDGTNEYEYTVYDKFMVEPQEIWVIKGSETEREITLITCDKTYDSTKRLIIKGRMED